MQIQKVKVNKPKTKKAALNQCVYIKEAQEILRKKENNLMNQRDQIQMKLQKLQNQQKELDKVIDSIRTSNKNWQVILHDLKLDWSLTEAEILETKSELLRLKISELQKEANIENEELDLFN